MIPESIKKRREETFSECRRLRSKINGSNEEKSQESASLGKASIHTPEDSNPIYITQKARKKSRRKSEPNGQKPCQVDCLGVEYEA